MPPKPGTKTRQTTVNLSEGPSNKRRKVFAPVSAAVDMESAGSLTMMIWNVICIRSVMPKALDTTYL